MITDQTDLLLVNSLRVIDEAVAICRYARLAPLFSGGHDSYCACFVASKHHKFDGNVYHIDTGIGSKATRAFVEKVCRDEGWKLNILKSPHPYTYEDYVRQNGFPGPGRHQYIYNRIKDKSISQITRSCRRHKRTILITGCRSAESVRRMGHVDKIKVGEWGRNGSLYNKHRIWTAPCYNWQQQDQIDFMNLYALSRNPLKESLLGMSGECFCGAFARPNEIDLIRELCPDVYEEIKRLETVVRDCGHHNTCNWGQRPTKNIEVLETGPLCTSCDLRARQAKLDVKQR